MEWSVAKPPPRDLRRRRRKVVTGVAGLLTAAAAVTAYTVLDRSETPADRSGSEVATAPQDAAGERARPTGAAVAPVAVSPLAPDAPSDGLGLGPAGRAGLRRLEQTDRGADGQTLARFFGAATNPVGGYAVGVPMSFEATAAGPVTFVDMNDSMFGAGFEVRSYRPVDPWARLVQDEKQFAREHAGDGYRREQLTRRWTYRGRQAVAWEFTWRVNGELMHARQVAFRDGPRTYTVLYRSKDLWWLGGGSAQWPEGFEQSFQPLP